MSARPSDFRTSLAALAGCRGPSSALVISPGSGLTARKAESGCLAPWFNHDPAGRPASAAGKQASRGCMQASMQAIRGRGNTKVAP